MKPSMTISRGAWLALATNVLLYGGVWLVAHRLRPIQWAGDPELTALVGERDRLHDASDATRDALRHQSDEVLRHAWTNEDLAVLTDYYLARCLQQTGYDLAAAQQAKTFERGCVAGAHNAMR